MNVTQFIAKVYLTSNGKTATLAATSPRYQKFLALANVLQDDWLSEPDIQWNSRYQRLSLGSINSDRVSLDEDIYEFSKREGDYITITGTSGNVSYWSLVSAEEMRSFRYNNVCAIIGDELVFARTFVVGDNEYGGEVIVPVTMKLDTLTQPSDDILVDDPNWLVYAVAAEQVRNTVTKLSQYPALIQKANNIMVKMKQKNDAQIDQIPMSPSVTGESWGSAYASNGYYGNSYGQPLGDD